MSFWRLHDRGSGMLGQKRDNAQFGMLLRHFTTGTVCGAGIEGMRIANMQRRMMLASSI